MKKTLYHKIQKLYFDHCKFTLFTITVTDILYSIRNRKRNTHTQSSGRSPQVKCSSKCLKDMSTQCSFWSRKWRLLGLEVQKDPNFGTWSIKFIFGLMFKSTVEEATSVEPFVRTRFSTYYSTDSWVAHAMLDPSTNNFGRQEQNKMKT